MFEPSSESLFAFAERLLSPLALDDILALAKCAERPAIGIADDRNRDIGPGDFALFVLVALFHPQAVALPREQRFIGSVVLFSVVGVGQNSGDAPPILGDTERQCLDTSFA